MPSRDTYKEDFVGDVRLLEESNLFNEAAYRAAAGIGYEIIAAEHYLQVGWRAGLESGPNFDGNFLYPYFRSVGLLDAPLITYIILREAGWPVYCTRTEVEPIADVIRTSDLFDANAYRTRMGLPADLDPALHYVLVGERFGHELSDRFDPVYYGERYPDIASAPICRLWHYLSFGRQENRRPVSVAAGLNFPRIRLNSLRKTVLLISHEASRTGAPILAYNIAIHLCRRYNVVVLLLEGGELVEDFKDLCNATIGPITHADWHPTEAKYIVRRLQASYSIAYAIVNSIESRLFIPPLARAFVPVLTLIHEFASYTRPKGAMGKALDWSTEIIFSTELTANSAISEHPGLSNRKIHIFPQGRCEVPRKAGDAPSSDVETLRKTIRPDGQEDAVVVLGAGVVHIRKGVDIFLSCAAAVARINPKRPVRFIWVGQGYDPENERDYSSYLGEQIARSGLEDLVTIIDAIDNLEPLYAMADIFLLSARLDPLPNVTIDAAFHGLPILCFENASGMASLLAADDSLKSCVVPYLDAAAAARMIVQLADDEALRDRIGDRMRQFAHATFDIDRYVSRIDCLGCEAVGIMHQRAADFATIRSDRIFDENIYLPLGSTVATREDAIRDFLCRWVAVGTNQKAAVNSQFRRPCVGFHPQIYAKEHSGSYDTAMVNPLAHYINNGKPQGAWQHDVIMPECEKPIMALQARAGLHAHFFYPELIANFLRKLDCNSSHCDLLLSTDTRTKENTLRRATADYTRGEVLVRVVPNRGRDIGALLTGFSDILARYDVIGHLHSKRSPFDVTLGDTWREFLWQHLLGDSNPMMDLILSRFAADKTLGLVFAEDPNLSDWDDNFEIANRLAARMGIEVPLPPFFEFPNGTMFWCRTAALAPMIDARFDWDEYPEEPLPYDGTVLHALERLLPFATTQAGYRFATTHIPGLSR